MWTVTIQDLTVVMRANFQQPVPKSDAQLQAKCVALMQALKGRINSRDISIESTDDLFAYTANVYMFEGLVHLSVNAEAVELRCTGANSKQGLSTAGAVVKLVSEIFVPADARNELNTALHAKFEKPEDYIAYMTVYANAEHAIEAGGMFLFGDGKTFDGKARLLTEKSFSFDNGVFLSFTANTPERMQGDLLNRVEARFNELAEFCKLKVIAPG